MDYQEYCCNNHEHREEQLTLGPIQIPALAVNVPTPIANGAAISVPLTPARQPYAQVNLTIPPEFTSSTVILSHSLGFTILTGPGQLLFRVFRDGTEIFYTEVSFTSDPSSNVNTRAFNVIDGNVPPGSHVYVVTAELLNTGITTAINITGPITFTGTAYASAAGQNRLGPVQITALGTNVPTPIVNGAAISVPLTPAKQGIAQVDLVISPDSPSNTVVLYTTVGFSVLAGVGQLLFRISRDGTEIYYTLVAFGPNGLNVNTREFVTVDGNVPPGSHTYVLTVERLNTAAFTAVNITGPITFSGTAYNSITNPEDNQQLARLGQFQISALGTNVPASITNGAAISVPITPAKQGIAQVNLFIPSAYPSNTVELSVTVGFSVIKGPGQILFRISRDGTEIFYTEVALSASSANVNTRAFTAIDGNVLPGSHAYVLTAEILNTGTASAANIVGPINFSGIAYAPTPRRRF